MKQKTQHYYVEVESPELLEVGHPICDGDVIIGFVYDSFNGRAEVMLWESMTFDFKDNMENISDNVDDVIHEKFAIAMVKAPEFIRQQWKDMIKEQNER